MVAANHAGGLKMTPQCFRIAVPVIVCATLAALPARGADDSEAVRVVPLLSQALPDLPGREVVMLTVEYLPGGASRPHRHDAHVFVYVLEGALRMQVAGRAVQTLGPGEVFYEAPDDVHQTSANASATEPARFLVVVLKDKGRPLTRPVAEARVP
jgi:quercetin dioxygenase-like cupin family protein